VRQVAAGEDELRSDAVDQGLEAGLETGIFMASEMQVGKVQNSCPYPDHSRGRLYTQNRGR
jgi:hypothetical protein